MKISSNWLDYGKLRISYGENGNREIGRYAALSNLSSGTYVYVTSGGAAYNVAQLSASNLSNPSLLQELLRCRRLSNRGARSCCANGRFCFLRRWYRYWRGFIFRGLRRFTDQRLLS